MTNVGLRRCWLLGDSLRERLLGVGEGVFTRRLGEERFSDGVGEGVARGPGEVRFKSCVGVDGREPKVRGPERSPTVPRPAAPEPASVWSAWRTGNSRSSGTSHARPWRGRPRACRSYPLYTSPLFAGRAHVLRISRLARRGGHLDGHGTPTARHCTLTSSLRGNGALQGTRSLARGAATRVERRCGPTLYRRSLRWVPLLTAGEGTSGLIGREILTTYAAVKLYRPGPSRQAPGLPCGPTVVPLQRRPASIRLGSSGPGVFTPGFLRLRHVNPGQAWAP